MTALMPPRKKNWKPGNYQIGVFVRMPDGSIFEAIFNDAEQSLAQAVAKPMLEQLTTTENLPFQIIVNGEKKLAPKSVLSFEDIVALAFDPIPENADTLSMTYRSRQPGSVEAGILYSGKSVRVRPDMVFNVVSTSNA